MSTTLNIDLPDLPADLASGVVLSVRDAKLHTVATARVGDAVELPAGNFVITADLPGQPGVLVAVEEGVANRVSLSTGALWTDPYASAAADWEETPLWLAPAALEGRHLQAVEALPPMELREGSLVFRAQQPAWIAVRAEGLAPRLVALPTVSPDEDCTLDLSQPLGPEDPLAVLFSQDDPAAAQLARYLVAGTPHAAQADALLALESLEDRASHPISGTLAALLLLRLGELEAMKTWPRFLARHFPHSDGAIAWAELAWRRGEEDESRRFSRKAISQGVPVFTESLSIAVGLLYRWQRVAEERYDGDRTALTRAAGFLGALNRWSIPSAVTVQIRLPQKYGDSLAWERSEATVRLKRT